MADAFIAIQQMGPLPITQTVNIESDAPILIYVSASAWTQTAGSWISVELLIDNTPVASVGLFANLAGKHMALVGPPISTQLSIGAHTFSLQVNSDQTVTDLNDAFGVTVLY